MRDRYVWNPPAYRASSFDRNGEPLAVSARDVGLDRSSERT
jgi:hypothetical protein